MDRQILLTGPALSAPSLLAGELAALDCSSAFVPDTSNPDFLGRIACGDFEGVVCGAEGEEAAQIVGRLRKENSKIPIHLVSVQVDSAFEASATSRGATSVVACSLTDRLLSENVARMMSLKLATATLEERSRTNERPRRELTEAVLERNVVSQSGGHITLHWVRRGLVPLLVENEPDEAFQMLRAFDKSEVYAPLPIMRSAQEALAYLQGSPPFENRNINPLPNAILLDLTPLSTGVDLFRWIRNQKEFTTIPVIALASEANPDDVYDCYRNLANSFLVKPPDFDELVAMIRSIDVD